jgi:hypothetical protein
VLVTAEGYPVWQLTLWDAGRSAWVWIVHSKTGRALPTGVLELTLQEYVGIGGSLALGWIYDATNGKAEGPVEWGNFPPIAVTETGQRIVEVRKWSVISNEWVLIVAKPTGRQLPPGTVELSIDQCFELCREYAATGDHLLALNRVLRRVPS